MKTKILAATILLSSCLTSWAWFPPSITQARISHIQVGQTTEADLVLLFGHPTTRLTDLRQYTSIDWFRSVPAPPQSYLPLIGSFLGGLDVEAQQLHVVLSPGGRVIDYEVYSSLGRFKTTRRVATATSYAK